MIVIAFFWPILLFGYNISRVLCYTIILDDEKIYIHEDTNTKRKKIQYYTFAKYTDIQSVEIIWSNRKSNGKRSSEHSITGGGEKLPYLKIKTKNGEKKLFMIFYTSKKTIKKLIIELEHRANESGNIIQIDDIDSIMKSIDY